jgi:N-carbamoyl-L-amino-acid hydrolase
MNRRSFLAHAAAMAVTPLGAHAAPSSPQVSSRPQASPLLVDGARVNGWLSRFDSVGRISGGINRVAYSEGDLAGRAFTLELYREAGLTPRIDAAGNIVARLEGRDTSAVPIVIGSHVDSVTDGGNFDGPLGSFAAIEVARSLRAQGLRLRHPLEVVVWANEEGGKIGSRLAVGEIASVDLDALARSGRSHRQGIGLIGGDVSKLAEAVRAEGRAHCYLELHIEQGARLEQAGRTIGVVEGIVGRRWLEVGITGAANHAGTTPMDQRQDAMLAAAKFTVAVHDTMRGEPGRHVATVGRVVPTPNTRNVIAGRVDLTVDVRDLDNARIEHFVGRFRAAAKEIGAATSTTFAISEATSSKPAMSDPRLMNIVQASADALGLTHQRMPSGAGHDAQHMALVCPMGMIFVPSVGGISHSLREFTRPEDVAHGLNALFNAVVRADAL